MRAGFTILTDLREYATSNVSLLDKFVAAQQLIVQAGVRHVAEVHQPDAETQAASATASARSAMPLRRFLDLWSADQFLDGV